MRLSDLSSEVIERIKAHRYDRFLEKHEGPFDWAGRFKYGDTELMQLGGFHVLLPVDRDQHANIALLRCVVSDDRQTLTLFLKDTTFLSDPEWETFDAGRVAICDRFEDQSFYLAVFYHEWYIT